MLHVMMLHPINVVRETDPPFPNNLPRGIGRCTEKVTLHRSCGHTEAVSCGSARGLHSKCKVDVEVRSSLCGHAITVPCWRQKSIEAWSPWSDDVENSLADGTLPLDAGLRSSNLQLPEKEVMDLLKSCTKHVLVPKSCGHTYKEKCRDLLNVVCDGGKSKKGTGCSEEVHRELPCGHSVAVLCKNWTKYVEGELNIPCKETTEKGCWNEEHCQSELICVPCDAGDNLIYCCDKRTEWTCKAGLHTRKLQLCIQGTPTSCPECESDTVASFISDIKTASAADLHLTRLSELPGCSEEFLYPLVDCVSSITAKSRIENKDQTTKFFSALADALGKFQSMQRQASGDTFQQPQLKATLLPVFYVMPHSKNKQKQGDETLVQNGFANIKHFIKADTLNGVAVHHLSVENMHSLASETKGGAKKSLLIGYLFCLNPKLGCSIPTGKTRMNTVKAWVAEGHDCIEFRPKKGRLLKPLIVWDPAPLYAMYSLGPLDADDMRHIADDIDRIGVPRLII